MTIPCGKPRLLASASRFSASETGDVCIISRDCGWFSQNARNAVTCSASPLRTGSRFIAQIPMTNMSSANPRDALTSPRDPGLNTSVSTPWGT